MGAKARAAVSLSSEESSVTSRRSPPTRSFNTSDVPSAMTRPWSITAIVSARRSASSRYCVVRRTVVPSSTRFSMTSHRLRRLRGSRPVVGSSRNRTGGLATSAAARSRRRRMPPEYVLTGRSAASTRSKLSSSSRPRARAVLRSAPYRRPTMVRFSRPVRFSSTAAYCPARPIFSRSSVAWLTTSRPTTEAVPASGFNRVVSTRTNVVLPAPFGPSRPSTVPRATSRSTSTRARTSPKDFDRPRTVMAGSLQCESNGGRESTVLMSRKVTVPTVEDARSGP